MKIVKASGELEPYNKRKLLTSLSRSQVPNPLQHQTLKYLQDKLHPGLTTRQLHDHVNFFLSHRHPTAAARYNLKTAIFELGPPGYPFEQLFSQILRRLGYRTQTNLELKGHCITHEIDVLAEKDNQYFMVECKHHRQPGSKSDAKVALYTFARFQDLQSSWNHDHRRRHPLTAAWLATNTKLTQEAYQFCRCQQIRITSWDRPPDTRLPLLIEKVGLYPITCLPSLTTPIKQALLDHHITTCQDLIKADSPPTSIIPKQLFKEAQHQAKLLCQE